MFNLKTLGGLRLERQDGSVAEVRGRWLALLAVIGAGEERGVSRDQVLGVLWPELDQGRGSHNLSQVLYSLRRLVGEELAVAAGQVLRLDGSKVSTDLALLQVAVRDRNWADVSRLYRGPFLAGFYLEDAPEFERWSEGVRGGLARDAEHAIEQYAEQCDRSGDAGEGRATWRRLADLDPLNSRFAYQYILALAKSGDRGGAVRHGLAHTTLLKEELGSAPPSRMLELMERLQRGTFVSTQREEIPKRPEPGR